MSDSGVNEWIQRLQTRDRALRAALSDLYQIAREMEILAIRNPDHPHYLRFSETLWTLVRSIEQITRM